MHQECQGGYMRVQWRRWREQMYQTSSTYRAGSSYPSHKQKSTKGSWRESPYRTTNLHKKPTTCDRHHHTPYSNGEIELDETIWLGTGTRKQAPRPRIR